MNNPNEPSDENPLKNLYSGLYPTPLDIRMAYARVEQMAKAHPEPLVVFTAVGIMVNAIVQAMEPTEKP